MNDFTKEELWFINEHLKNSIDCNGVINPRLVMPILNKIQTMIDNYCDHEFVVFNKEHNHVECIKCGAIK